MPDVTNGRLMLAVLLLVLAAAGCFAQEAQPPKSNLAALQLVSARLGDQIAAVLATKDTGSIVVSVLPREPGWIVEVPMGNVLVSRGFRPGARTDCRYRVDLGVLRMAIVYSDIRRDGFFGPKVVDRRAELSTDARIIDHADGSLLVSREMHQAWSDTVEVSAIESLETLGLPVTHAELPGEGLFASIVEPVVTVGAIGVAVLLLFTVRH